MFIVDTTELSTVPQEYLAAVVLGFDVSSWCKLAVLGTTGG